ncbi:MAG TPA: DUF4179 domain-containing protein [Candidatus Limiplasma sp.]|nr:DUF4179 domain-containing protein [Candidatus Limiplasma sp.]
MKKKLSLSMAMIIAISILLVGAAIAASLGVFGQFAELPYGSGELENLEENAAVYGETQTIDPTASGEDAAGAQDVYTAVLERQGNRTIQFTLEQGYFDGNKVAISYTIHEPDKAEPVFGEGLPTGDIPWDMEMEGGSYVADLWPPDALAYLDTQEPVYVIVDYAVLGDGLFLADGTPLENATSDEQTNVDGDLQGYKTYQGVPEAWQDADSIDVYCNILYGSQIIYQDDTGYKVAWIANPSQNEAAQLTFTLSRNSELTQLSGAVEFAQYSAKAEVELSQAGATSTITMECPQSWVNVTTGEGETADEYVSYYQLYADDVKCPFTSGAVKDEDATHLVFMDEFSLPESYETLVLVPVYYNAGENWDEAITLQ